jgi:hypothetical protein
MASIAAIGDESAVPAAPTWALPTVSGWAWPWVRAMALALLALALTMEFFGLQANYKRAQVRPFAHIGLSGWKTIDGEVTIRAPHTREATDAGLREGQTLIAVDGVAVGNRMSDMQLVDRLLTKPEGSTIVLRTRSPDGAIAEHRVTKSKANGEALYAGSGISGDTGLMIMLVCQALPDLFLLFVAIMLLRSRRRESVGLLFAFGFIGLVLTGPSTFSLYSSDWQLAFAQAIAALSMIALAFALLSFPDGRMIGRSRQGIAVLAVIVVAAGRLFSAIGDETVWFIIYPVTIVLPTIALFARSRETDVGAARQQIRFALFGFAIGAVLVTVAVLLNILSPPLTLQNIALTTWLFIGSMILGALAMIALAGGLLLSLLRYRLYDVDTLISRSAAYGVMTVGFVGAFAGLENVIEQAAQTYFSGDAGKAAGAISAALAAALIGPMHNRIHGWTERRFRKGLVAMRRDLPHQIDDLRETATFDELAAAIEPAIARGVAANWVRLRPPALLEAGDVDERGELERPIVAADGRALSLLEVGPRPDGSPHGKDEREAVDALVEPLARALAVIERREAKEQALERRIGALEQAVRALNGKKPAPAK